MKIYQGYQSKSMGAFNFLKMHHIEEYNRMDTPLVVFGCYDRKDIDVIKRHNSTVVIQWEGLDSKKWNDLSVFKHKNIVNVTPHPNIREYFISKGLNCTLIKWVIDETKKPQTLGNKVYTYLNKRNREYYGGEVVNSLDIPFDFLIGDYTQNTVTWDKDANYSQAFIGLSLSQYAAGGFSIVEMGLRGIPVVTNILQLPHCISWKTKEDIEQAILNESKNIGKINTELANMVYDSVLCSERLKCYDLEQLVL